MTEGSSSALASGVPVTRLARVRGAPITGALIAVNTVVFLFAESRGRTTEPITLIRFGADEATIVWTGDFWRLATSMFLHIGWGHFLWNTYGSWGWCEPVERAMGRSRFLATYLVAGIGGSCASVLAHDVVSAGASGAVFGIVGARLVLAWRASADRRAFFASPVTRRTLRNTAIWFALGVTVVRMDNFAHLGGLFTGIAVTALLTSPMPMGRSTAILVLSTCMLFVVGTRPWHDAPSPLEASYLAWYGDAYATGRGLVRDVSRAERFLRLACKTGDTHACDSLGWVLRERHTPEADVEALGLFRKACAGEQASACGRAAFLLSNGLGGPVDLGAALRLYSKGCDLGDPGSCEGAAFAQFAGRGTPVDRVAARDLYLKACDRGKAASCAVAAAIEDDPETRADLYKRACSMGSADGCAGFADARYRGVGAPIDRQAGLDGLRQACDHGSKWACDRARDIEAADAGAP